MFFSVIIPTYNEEKFLPILLKSIQQQSFHDYEIIVADNHSKDKTRIIAQKHACQIVAGNMPGPARNNGAKEAKGQWLVFLDADITVEPDFLAQIKTAITAQKFIAATTNVRPLSSKLFDHLFFSFSNFSMWLLQYLRPVAHGFIMVVKKEAFNQVRGFDEDCEIGEDFDLATRLGKIGRFKVLTNIYVNVSVRRFDRDGRINILWKLVKSTFKILVLKQKKLKSHYEWGKYTKD
jgi:glycosyltransferase involved in cell wall biosynthesis